MKRHVLMLLVVSIVATACSAGEDPAPSPPPDGMPPQPTEVETETEPAGYSATEIPAVEDIDLAYVQWVIADAITPVTDLIIQLQVDAADKGATKIPFEVIDLYATIYGGEHLQFSLTQTYDQWDGDSWDSDVRSDPGPAVVRVLEIVDSSATCIIAVFERDLSARVESSQGLSTLMALLNPKPSDADPEQMNPSPWRIVRQFVAESVSGDPSC